MLLQKYSSKTYQGISSSKTKSNAISKEPMCYAEKMAPRKHPTGEGGNGLCFNETSLSRNQSAKEAGTGNWQLQSPLTGEFFFSSSICEKSHSRREEMSLSFIPPQTKVLNTQAVCFPRWFRGSCARVNYLPSNKCEKCSLPWTAKLWPLGPICEICVCRIRSLIFLKKRQGR